ncbi:MAG TPA: FAD-binding oxidoreductase [Candidatus Limnocylindria bacterium]|nr:FAD-binding oxidoreductase [Candidatus Limnocylindria bacterium]
MQTPSRVAIIGGGIIGCAAAAFLAEQGASVTLFEQTAIGAGASGRNLGAIQHPFDPLLAPLYHDSLDRYRRLADTSDGFSVPAEPAGLLLLNADPAAVRRQVAHFSEATPDLRPTFVDEPSLADAEPALATGFSACRLATGYPVPPDSATAAYAALAVQRGAIMRIGIAAEPWVADGRLRGVVLADGSGVRADAVLIAAGPWSPPLVDADGGWVPIHRTWGVTVQLRLDQPMHHVVEEDEVDSVNRPAVATARAAAGGTEEPPSLFSMASADGVSTVGSTFLPNEPEPGAIARLLLARARRFVPAVATAEVVQTRMCARPQSVDGRPFIGPVGGIDGLFVCAGHGPWGISTGPASAALVAEAILGGADAIPGALRADRDVQSAQPFADTGRSAAAG